MAINALNFTKKCLQSSRFLRTINPGAVVCIHEYSKWTHRTPAKIVNGDDIFEEPKEEEPVAQKVLKKYKPSFRRPRERKVKEKKTIIQPGDPDATLNDDGSPVFLKLKDNDPTLHTLMLTIKSRRQRDKNNEILLEGRRLIVDAIEAGAVPKMIIFSRITDVEKLPLPPRGVKLYKVTYSTMQLWSDLTTSPGIFGIFETPAVDEKEPATDALPLTIICDNVREPGNLGTILRAAAGVGCDRVILTKGCVDLWEPKVLRSAAGAHFRVPILKSQTWSDVQSLISDSARVFLADNNTGSNAGNNADSNIVSSIDSSSDSETSDSDSETSDSDTEKEVKNVAEQVHPDLDKKDGQKTEKATADAEVVDKSNAQELEEPLVAARGAMDKVETGLPKNKNVVPTHCGIVLPILPYFEADYTENEVVIIIGGETEGLSNQSFSWAQRRNGVRVNVPLTNGVNSLNTGTAMCVIAFEVKRQFLMRQKNV